MIKRRLYSHFFVNQDEAVIAACDYFRAASYKTAMSFSTLVAPGAAQAVAHAN